MPGSISSLVIVVVLPIAERLRNRLGPNIRRVGSTPLVAVVICSVPVVAGGVESSPQARTARAPPSVSARPSGR